MPDQQPPQTPARTLTDDHQGSHADERVTADDVARDVASLNDTTPLADDEANDAPLDPDQAHAPIGATRQLRHVAGSCVPVSIDDITRDAPPDDRFIPIATQTLIRALVDHAPQHNLDPNALNDTLQWIVAVIEQEAAAYRRTIESLYDPFNPDRDIVHPIIDDTHRSEHQRDHIAAHVAYLLEKANYRLLDRPDVEKALQTANTQGLRVKLRPDVVEDLQLWIRGISTVSRRFKTPRAPIRGVTRQVPVYRRLIVLTRLRDQDTLHLKMFRNIPTADLEALLPHARVAMNTLDKLKIMGGAGGALGSLTTALTAASGGLYAILYALALPFGIIGWRTFSGWRRARIERDRQLTRNLYYMNLGSNAAVIHTLLARTAEEEAKEAVLAYAAAAFRNQTPFDTERQLDAWCEMYLEQHFNVRINFDAPDALETLQRIGLWEPPESLRVIEPQRALPIVARHWKQRRSWSYHARRAEDYAKNLTPPPQK